MSYDIVTRLRKCHEWFGSGGEPTSLWEDAADEIEWLREQVEYWQQRCMDNREYMGLPYNKKAWWKR